jgi:hypothetical protein
MDTQAIFGLQFILSLAAWSAVGLVVISPALQGKPKGQALMWLALPHMFRHVGMVFLVPGLTYEALPSGFAGPAAYGDLATGVLALAAVFALRANWRGGLALAVLFNVVGSLDLLNALRHTEVAPLFGAAWYIPTMLVPLLLVTHVMSFSRLLRR